MPLKANTILRHGTQEKGQNGFKAFLGTRAVAQLAGLRLSTHETQKFIQKLHFCTIKLPQFNFHEPRTIDNVSNNLNLARNNI